MSRKNFVYILPLLFVLSISSCGNNPDKNETEPLSSDFSGVIYSEENNIDNESETVSAQYSVGDIIFADGSAEKTENVTEINKVNPPIAVIAGFKADATAFGVGVHRSSEPLQWALDDTVGYSVNFSNTVCTQNNDMTFGGDTDGTDNWSEICAIDGSGSVSAKKNYPAFYFVNIYAENCVLPEAYTSDWYMPSISELCIIYENCKAINTSLEKIFELDDSAAMDGLVSNWYWSSSQSSAEDDYVWFVHFLNGYAGECPKNFDNLHVLAVHNF